MDIRNVLLVDDEEDIRTLGELSLEAVGGWPTSVASSGMDALNKVEQKIPDVVLLDALMPEMDGATTFSKLRDRHPNVPVIFLTGNTQRSDLNSFLALGAVGVIHKPFDPMSLPAQVRGILNEVVP